MKKSEIFNLILDITSDVCEVKRTSILCSDCRLQPVVDARCIALHFLHKVGLSDDDIAFLSLRESTGIEWPDWKDISNKGRSYESLRKTYDDKMSSFAFREMVKSMKGKYKEIIEHREG